MSRSDNAQQGKAAALKIGSLKVNGLLTPGRAHACVKLWMQQRLDVVLLQETHLQTGRSLLTANKLLEEAASQLCCGGYTPYWALAGEPSSGVGILIRTALLTSGAMQLIGKSPDTPYVPVHDAAGRWIMIPARWGGHRINLVSVYLPASSSVRRQEFIKKELGKLYKKAGAHIWGGDYNFVPSPPWDRVRFGNTQEGEPQYRNPPDNHRDSRDAAVMRGDLSGYGGSVQVSAPRAAQLLVLSQQSGFTPGQVLPVTPPGSICPSLLSAVSDCIGPPTCGDGPDSSHPP
jgi:hypothetical protein